MVTVHLAIHQKIRIAAAKRAAPRSDSTERGNWERIIVPVSTEQLGAVGRRHKLSLRRVKRASVSHGLSTT